LGQIKQDELAGLLEIQGKEAFQKELERLREKKGKRGIPRDKFLVSRIMFDKADPPDMELYKKLEELAKTENMKLDEYCKKILHEHVETKI